MEITLRIDGKDKTFTQEFAPLKIYRKALDIEKYAKSEDNDTETLLDKRLNLVVEIFEKQFTKDEIENGLNVVNHDEVLYDIIGVNVLGFPSREELKKREMDLTKFLQDLQKNASPSKKQ